MSARWMKMLRDARTARGRLLMIVCALAVSIAAVLTMLGAYSVLAREVPANYQGSNPASAQLQAAGPIDPALLERIAGRPNIAAAELAGISMARVEVAPGTWLPMRIFVVPDFDKSRINTLGRESGAWPPPPGTLLIERSALALSRGALGQPLTIEFRRSGRHRIPIGGVVHDPGLAPAWQESVLYGYATPHTLAQLGEQVPLDLLKIVVTKGADDAAPIESTTRALALWLGTVGVHVHEARIPPPLRHPHQAQMDAVLVMLLIFSLFVLLLGSILTATIIGGLLIAQVRQIAIMKSLGARTAQVAGMYLALVAVLATLGLAIGLPLGEACGRALIASVANLLNLRIASTALPASLFALVAAVGLVAPLLAALAPIIAAARSTVQAALQDQHVRRDLRAGAWMQRLLIAIPTCDPALTLALRNVLRRRVRFMLTMLLLAGAGAMFLTSMNLRAAWEHHVARAAADRHFDIELRLQESAPAERVEALVKAGGMVRHAEAWSTAPAEVAGADGLDISRRYPDGGHGSLVLRAAPPETTLVARAMSAGRWLRTGDMRAAVINSQAQASILQGAALGSVITLAVGEGIHSFEVVGVVRDILASATVYITPSSFAAATGSAQRVNAVRIALSDPARADAAASAIAAALAREKIIVKATLTDKSSAAAQGSHIYILVWVLGAIAATMCIVGLLGLASSLGASVIERTREFGIMRTVGASSGAVLRSVLYEGALSALASALLAVMAAVLPSAIVGRMLGSVSDQELALQLSPSAALLWLAGVLIAALAVSYIPAARAARLTIRQTLDQEQA